MGDEILGSNVISVHRDPTLHWMWIATIGSRTQGARCAGTTPAQAIMTLALLCEREGWTFDPSWKPQSA